MIQPPIQDSVLTIFNNENKQHMELKIFVPEVNQGPIARKYDLSTINNYVEFNQSNTSVKASSVAQKAARLRRYGFNKPGEMYQCTHASTFY